MDDGIQCNVDMTDSILSEVFLENANQDKKANRIFKPMCFFYIFSFIHHHIFLINYNSNMRVKKRAWRGTLLFVSNYRLFVFER